MTDTGTLLKGIREKTEMGQTNLQYEIEGERAELKR